MDQGTPKEGESSSPTTALKVIQFTDPTADAVRRLLDDVKLEADELEAVVVITLTKEPGSGGTVRLRCTSLPFLSVVGLLEHGKRLWFSRTEEL